MVENGVDHFLVAVDDVENAVGQTRFLHQLRESHGDGRIPLRGLEDERVTAGDRHSEHPHRDHRWKVERRDPGPDAERLAHRIDIDARTGPNRIFAFQRLRDAARIFDDFQAALNVAFGIRNDLAVLGTEEMREFVHVRFDQLLEPEHHAGAALRVGRGPGGLRASCRFHRRFEVCRRAQADMGLNLALVGIEHFALALPAGKG